MSDDLNFTFNLDDIPHFTFGMPDDETLARYIPIRGEKGDPGDGDMSSSVYDTNHNGIVDNAEKVNNHTVATNVPADAVFTDTVYDDTAIVAALNDKANTADLATVASSGAYSDLTGTPTLATVATSGSYNDLSNKPTIPTATSNLTNDGSDGTSTYVEADDLATVATDGITVLHYGISTWDEFIAAYNDNRVIFCRASTNADPSVGSQTRNATLAYVDNETAPTTVQFNFVRSIASLTDAQQTAQVFIYTLNDDNSWTVVAREAGTRVIAGSNMTSWYNNGAITLYASVPTNVTSDVSPATNVSLDSGFRVMKVGSLVVVTGSITVSSQIGDYGVIISGLPVRSPASAFYFPAISTTANSIYRMYISAQGTLAARVLPAGNYAISVVYTTT